MRVLKIAAIVIGGLLLLVLVAVAIAIKTIDIHSLIGPIQTRVKEATGRELAIRGDIDLKPSLDPKLVLNDVSLGNAAWAKTPQMISAKRVEAQIALLPLLQRRFEIVRFTLVEPTIALETDAHGVGNWEFSPAQAKTPGAAPASNTASLAGVVAVGDIAISNGVLTYHDGKTGKLTNVAIDSLTVHARDAQSAVSAVFRGRVDDMSVALEGDFGPLDALMQRRWPYPVAVKGDVNGQKANLSSKVKVVEQTVTWDDVDLDLGSSKVLGQIAVTTGGPRPKLVLKLTSPALSLADASLAAVTAPAQAPKQRRVTSQVRYVFGDTSVPFDVLRAVDADADITIGQLTLPNGLRIADVHARFTVQDGKLDAPAVQALALGGNVRAQLKIDATNEREPRLSVRVDGKNLRLAAILDAAGIVREVRGGDTEVVLDLTMHGTSPRQWASGANGSIKAVVGPATLTNTRVDLDSSFARLAEAVNPFRATTPTTELQCAVIRLPLSNGVAKVDRTIAVETKQIGASASGTLDFRNETLDLSIKPQVRQGVPIDVPQVAELVRFHGPFVAPQVGIDAVASAATVARLAAAVETGGLSIVGESLFKRASAGGSPCQVALGHTSAGDKTATRPTTSNNPAAPLVDDVSKALGRVLGR